MNIKGRRGLGILQSAAKCRMEDASCTSGFQYNCHVKDYKRLFKALSTHIQIFLKMHLFLSVLGGFTAFSVTKNEAFQKELFRIFLKMQLHVVMCIGENRAFQKC